jgi:hypothetical protein
MLGALSENTASLSDESTMPVFGGAIVPIVRGDAMRARTRTIPGLNHTRIQITRLPPILVLIPNSGVPCEAVRKPGTRIRLSQLASSLLL